jgi:SAM-dependent methyltransferase
MPSALEFRCIVCGTKNRCESILSRESGHCSTCGSTVRMRAAIFALSMGLYGRPLDIASFPKRPRFRGVGLSDWDGYAARLRRVLDYRNTRYDRRPALDITAVPERERSRYDFVLSIDVFEHIPPPVGRAFEGAAALLRSGGLLVFSAPYTLDEQTVEHFPHLDTFRLAEHAGVPYLINKRRDGRLEWFDDLVFHGAEGFTLEMRLFARGDIERHLRQAGFGSVTLVDDVPEYGIVYDNACSHTFIARRT